MLSILRDADGQAISDIAIVQDISDRKQIEQAFEEERSLFIGGPTVVVRWGPTDDWPVEYVSPNVKAQFGYEPSDLMEGRVAFASLIHPDDSEATKQAMLAAIPDLLIRLDRRGLRYDLISGGEITLYSDVDTQRPQSIYEMLPQALVDQRLYFIRQALDTGERQIHEYVITIAGKRYYEEARIVPLEGDEVLIMVRDITDRVTAEQALRESQQRFQAIFDQMYQFVGLLTPEGILLEVNQTALAFGGFGREDVIGRPFWEVGWWNFALETQTQLKQAIAAAGRGEFVRYEVAI